MDSTGQIFLSLGIVGVVLGIGVLAYVGLKDNNSDNYLSKAEGNFRNANSNLLDTRESITDTRNNLSGFNMSAGRKKSKRRKVVRGGSKKRR